MLFSYLAIKDVGLQFDASPIVSTLAAEGEHFALTPKKVTFYPEDFRLCQECFEGVEL